MAELDLTPKERQALKGRAHGLDPVVLLGAGGLSPAVLKEIDRALTAHELIKVRVPGDDRDEREAVFLQVADQLSAARVQSIGKLLVLFRPQPDEDAAADGDDDAATGRRPAARKAAAPRARKAPPPLPKKAAGNRTKGSTAGAARSGKPGRSEIRRERAQAPRRAPRSQAARKSGRR